MEHGMHQLSCQLRSSGVTIEATPRPLADGGRPVVIHVQLFYGVCGSPAIPKGRFISNLDEFHSALTSLCIQKTQWHGAGYKPLPDPSAAYEMDPMTEHSPFILHLVSQGKIDVLL